MGDSRSTNDRDFIVFNRRERPRRQFNSHFLPKPLKRGKGPGHGERALGEKLPCEWTPPPFLLGISVNDFEYFGRKTKIEN